MLLLKPRIEEVGILNPFYFIVLFDVTERAYTNTPADIPKNARIRQPR